MEIFFKIISTYPDPLHPNGEYFSLNPRIEKEITENHKIILHYNFDKNQSNWILKIESVFKHVFEKVSDFEKIQKMVIEDKRINFAKKDSNEIENQIAKIFNEYKTTHKKAILFLIWAFDLRFDLSTLYILENRFWGLDETCEQNVENDYTVNTLPPQIFPVFYKDEEVLNVLKDFYNSDKTPPIQHDILKQAQNQIYKNQKMA